MTDTAIIGGTGGPSVFKPAALKQGEPSQYAEFTLADDTATYFTLPWANGVAEFTVSDGTVTTQGSVIFKSGASPALIPMYAVEAAAVITGSGAFTVGIGASVVLGTTALTGTVGTDAKLNVACTGGKLYFENRLGASKTVYVCIRR